MLTAVVAHAPTFGGKVKSVDAAAARQVAGVRAVFEVPTGVAVVADHYWAAKVGRDALRIDWDLGPHAALDTTEIRRAFAEQAKTPGLTAAAGGDVAKALAGGSSAGHKVLSADYHVPYLAHAPMEPLNCTVQRTAEGCEVWTGTQFQTVDQQRVAAIFEVKPEQVNVHTTFLGGGFGRRANVNSDFVVEAAHVAKGAEAAGVFKVNGADQAHGAQGADQVRALPIKLVWPREDDIRGGYYRPMALHRLHGAIDAKGEPVAWRQNIVTQSILGGSPFAAMMKDGIDPTCVEGASDSPYVTAIPHHRVALNVATLGVPVLWWRSVGNSHTAFAVESFVDEMAHAAKRDPLEFRLALLRKAPRVRAVLALAAEKAGWGTALPAGRARGLAVHESFGSIVAQVAEVSVHGSRIQVHRVVAAVDCGICVNPLGVGAQIESAVAFGLGAALHSEVTMKEMPHVEVHIVPSREKSGGVGEPGTPPIAPAVANAVFALTGKRLRELPFQLA
jgi:isoquinoline 1-oxidoreductase beta subunit